MSQYPTFQFQLKRGESSRRVRFRDLTAEGLVRLEAVDGEKPAIMEIKAGEFPWASFARFITQAWQQSRPVPPQFRLQVRLPEEIITSLQSPHLEDSGALQILRALRKSGFIPGIHASANC